MGKLNKRPGLKPSLCRLARSLLADLGRALVDALLADPNTRSPYRYVNVSIGRTRPDPVHPRPLMPLNDIGQPLRPLAPLSDEEREALCQRRDRAQAERSGSYAMPPNCS